MLIEKFALMLRSGTQEETDIDTHKTKDKES